MKKAILILTAILISSIAYSCQPDSTMQVIYDNLFSEKTLKVIITDPNSTLRPPYRYDYSPFSYENGRDTVYNVIRAGQQYINVFDKEYNTCRVIPITLIERNAILINNNNIINKENQPLIHKTYDLPK